MNSTQTGKTGKTGQGSRPNWWLKLWRSTTEKTDTDLAVSPAEMHRDYAQWRSEHVAWLQDISLWLREQRRANGLIYRIEQALPDLGHTLNAHAGHIRQHENVLKEHERILAECEQGKTDPKRCAELAKAHQQSYQRHKQVSEQHARFQETRLAAIVELKRLLELLREK